MKAPLINIQIPQYWLEKAGDYHEFINIKDTLRNIGIPVFYEEEDFNGEYRAIFWIGEKPTQIIKKYQDE